MSQLYSCRYWNCSQLDAAHSIMPLQLSQQKLKIQQVCKFVLIGATAELSVLHFLWLGMPGPTKMYCAESPWKWAWTLSSFDWPIGLLKRLLLFIANIHLNPLRSALLSRDLASLRMQQWILSPWCFNNQFSQGCCEGNTIRQCLQWRNIHSLSLCRCSFLKESSRVWGINNV